MAYIYLASPYSHPSELVRHQRYLAVAEVCASFLRDNITVYSPIVHCHELAKRHSLPKGFDFWEYHNYEMLKPASQLLVLELDGWKESKGLKGEIEFAIAHSIPVVQTPFPLQEL